jgi:thioredoxin-related protein
MAVRASLLAIAGFAASALVGSAAGAAELVMFETQGCPFCAAWHRDVGGVYAKTDEGKRLPLRRVDLQQERPADLRHIQNVWATPTFVAVDDEREIGRIVGYRDEDQFWGLLGVIVGRLKAGAERTNGQGG